MNHNLCSPLAALVLTVAAASALACGTPPGEASAPVEPQLDAAPQPDAARDKVSPLNVGAELLRELSTACPAPEGGTDAARLERLARYFDGCQAGRPLRNDAPLDANDAFDRCAVPMIASLPAEVRTCELPSQLIMIRGERRAEP